MTDFPQLCDEYISISLSAHYDFIDLLQNLLPFFIHILFGLQLDTKEIF